MPTSKNCVTGNQFSMKDLEDIVKKSKLEHEFHKKKGLYDNSNNLCNTSPEKK